MEKKRRKFPFVVKILCWYHEAMGVRMVLMLKVSLSSSEKEPAKKRLMQY